jgi:hypothetical protein
VGHHLIKWRVKTRLGADMAKHTNHHKPCQVKAAVVVEQVTNNNHRLKDTKFMLAILTLTLTTLICYKLSKESIHLASRPKSFVILLLEFQKAMDSLNLV